MDRVEKDVTHRIMQGRMLTAKDLKELLGKTV